MTRAIKLVYVAMIGVPIRAALKNGNGGGWVGVTPFLKNKGLKTMIVKDEHTLVAFVNADQPPIRTKHICYFTSTRDDEIQLCEVFEATYPHPEAPEDAVIPVIDMRLIRSVKRTDYQAAPLILMEAQQKNMRTIEVRQ